MDRTKFASCLSHLRFALLAAALVVTGACGGDDGNDIPPTPDGDITLPAADAAPCDISQQDCAGGDEKCTVALSSMNTWSSVCRKAGAVAVGEMCTREKEGSAGVGLDDCALGGYCTARGNAMADFGVAQRRCRKFCRDNAACTGAGEKCVQLTDLMPPDGICIPACTPFNDTYCTGGAWCDPRNDLNAGLTGECTTAGPIALGGTCGDLNMNGSLDMDESCVANAICITPAMATTSLCAQLCDIAGTAAPCPMGQTCQGVNGLPTQVGVCRPPAMKPGNGPAFTRYAPPQR